MNIVCIRHPKYDGVSSPILACKACCAMFMGHLKEAKAKENTK